MKLEQTSETKSYPDNTQNNLQSLSKEVRIFNDLSKELRELDLKKKEINNSSHASYLTGLQAYKESVDLFNNQKHSGEDLLTLTSQKDSIKMHSIVIKNGYLVSLPPSITKNFGVELNGETDSLLEEEKKMIVDIYGEIEQELGLNMENQEKNTFVTSGILKSIVIENGPKGGAWYYNDRTGDSININFQDIKRTTSVDKLRFRIKSMIRHEILHLISDGSSHTKQEEDSHGNRGKTDSPISFSAHRIFQETFDSIMNDKKDKKLLGFFEEKYYGGIKNAGHTKDSSGEELFSSFYNLYFTLKENDRDFGIYSRGMHPTYHEKFISLIQRILIATNKVSKGLIGSQYLPRNIEFIKTIHSFSTDFSRNIDKVRSSAYFSEEGYGKYIKEILTNEKNFYNNCRDAYYEYGNDRYKFSGEEKLVVITKCFEAMKKKYTFGGELEKGIDFLEEEMTTLFGRGWKLFIDK